MSISGKTVRHDLKKLADRTNRQRWMTAGIVGAAILTAATGAQAGEGHWKHGRGHYAPYYVAVPPGHVRYYAPPPVVYAAPPMVVYPAPVVYAPAYPVYDGPASPSLNLGINIPLR